MESVKTDVLVIGAGAAGLRAALAASEAGVEVTVVAKTQPGRSGATFSPHSKNWGYQALVGVEQTPPRLQAFFDDIMRIGLGCCDPHLVQILVEESGPRWEELRDWGIRFHKINNGRYARVKGCFSDAPRAFITAERTIRQVRPRLKQTVAGLFTLGEALALNVSRNVCGGAWVWIPTGDGRGEILQIDAGSTILATGGGAGLFRQHLVGRHELGHGYALAHAAGASLINMEFIQFMLAIKHTGRLSFLPISNLQEPNRLTDAAGPDLVAAAIPDEKQREKAIALRQRHVPFSCRDQSAGIDLAVARHLRDDEPVFWNAAEKSTEPARVVHCAHAFNGGIEIDAHGQSSVEGLFAAGEVAAGPHGADRIGGCMLTATQVFGRRAGRHAARHCRRSEKGSNRAIRPTFIADFMQQSRGSGCRRSLAELIRGVSQLFSRELGILRHGNGLQACLNLIGQTQAEILDRYDSGGIERIRAYNTLSAMRLITRSALARKESLGSHFREDFPPGRGDPGAGCPPV